MSGSVSGSISLDAAQASLLLTRLFRENEELRVTLTKLEAAARLVVAQKKSATSTVGSIYSAIDALAQALPPEP